MDAACVCMIVRRINLDCFQFSFEKLYSEFNLILLFHILYVKLYIHRERVLTITKVKRDLFILPGIR